MPLPPRRSPPCSRCRTVRALGRLRAAGRWSLLNLDEPLDVSSYCPETGHDHAQRTDQVVDRTDRTSTEPNLFTHWHLYHFC
jgi:hypothetical protein